MVSDLIKLNVSKKNIYIVETGKKYDLGRFSLEPIETYHDVRNMSYKINFKPKTIYYVTDTNKLDYLETLKGLDYYFIENNYSDEEIRKRIEEKKLNGEYSYEYRVINSHLSQEETNKFLMEMMNDNSQFVYCHQHIDKEENNE